MRQSDAMRDFSTQRFVCGTACLSLSSSGIVLQIIASLCLSLLAASPGLATELTSASFRHRSGSFASSVSAGHGAMSSSAAVPMFGSSEATLAEGAIVAPSGSSATLSTIWPGFWAIVAGPFASLDLDGDLAQFFLDEDDDGDGLEDVHETGTGFFVSATNTGTSPTRVDSDGDGLADGVEVAAGSDPNDPLSGPPPAAVPSSSWSTRLVLFGLLLGLTSFVGLRARKGIQC